MHSFSNLKIRTKLMAGFAIVALLAGAIGFVGDLNMRLLDDRDTELHGNTTKALRSLGTASAAFHELSKSCYTARADAGDSLHTASTSDRLHSYAVIDENLRAYASTVTDSAALARVQALSLACRKFVDDAGTYERLVQEGRSFEARKFRRSVLDRDDLIVTSAFRETSEAGAEEAQMARIENSDLVDASRSLMLFLLGTAVVSALGLGFYMSIVIKRQFEQQEAFWIEQQPMGSRAAAERFTAEDVEEPPVRLQVLKTPDAKLADAPAMQNQPPVKKMRVFFDDTIEYNGNESLTYR